MRHVLTPAQERTLAAIVDFIEAHGWPPSIREIAAETDVTSSTAQSHVRALARKGYLIVGGNPRQLRVVA